MKIRKKYIKTTFPDEYKLTTQSDITHLNYNFQEKEKFKKISPEKSIL